MSRRRMGGMYQPRREEVRRLNARVDRRCAASESQARVCRSFQGWRLQTPRRVDERAITAHPNPLQINFLSSTLYKNTVFGVDK